MAFVVGELKFIVVSVVGDCWIKEVPQTSEGSARILPAAAPGPACRAGSVLGYSSVSENTTCPRTDRSQRAAPDLRYSFNWDSVSSSPSVAPDPGA